MAVSGKARLGDTVTWNGHTYKATELAVFYKPHTVSLLLMGMIVLLAAGLWQTSPADGTATKVSVDDMPVRAAWTAGGAAFSVYLLYALLQFPDGLFTRPHPAVWRVVLALSLAYLVALVFVFFLPVASARGLLTLLDPSLGSKLELPLYATDCSLSWANVSPKLWDIFVVAHFAGWFVKALMIRNIAICITLSVLWELVELSLVTMLPNFGECWWDQLIMDILVCNGGGMMLGLYLGGYFEMKEYNWVGFRAIESVRGKVRRAALQFTPQSWTTVEWKMFSSYRRLGAIAILIAGITVVELNAFLLKAVLWVPSSNWLNLLRLGLWVAFGAPTLREYYQYITDPHCKKLGTQAWVALACMLAETAIAFKFGLVYFAHLDVLVPAWIWGLWLAAGAAFLAAYSANYSRAKAQAQGKRVWRHRPASTASEPS
ncbi:phosphatidylserine synthase [Thecamonas trahens ATCC 50062]|uniref:Phosphatidylserine synthase n=1 Tax=Thecamonas trahens ATCC 50062 TaxID=461836 RepID=A0A0L0D856_THETB|nr:phosphatidylserine synthase [Thecamonas trahens ATCC 50062]KNC48246.1 phosphatidylserine synthase [Thecamonas trahens ATCC 50062]|eukprot:XP_013758815.1 phosphatidylserine synthase [Thecamonas trahens ATCC 50062]